MQTKQILLAALIIANNNYNNIHSAENSVSKNINLEVITKKDLENFATKAEINQLINPVKRSRWFMLGALAGAGATCILREHKSEIKASLKHELELFTKQLEQLTNSLKEIIDETPPSQLE